MIALRQFSASLGGQTVLRGVDFAAGPGEFVAICGPNGAGKTTLLRALAGLMPGMRADPARIAYVEQGARSAWGLTVREVVALGRIPHRDGDQGAIEAALQSCGLVPLAARRIDQLSGGQARRVMLARALATQAPVLLLDEPVADLDPAASHDIMRLLAGLASSGNCIVAVLHAADLAVKYATRMVVLSGGRIAADGPPRLVLPEAARQLGMAVGIDDDPRLLPAAVSP